MKFLVVLSGLLAVARATPLEPGYGLPAAPPVAVAPVPIPAPIEQVTIPAVAPPLAQPAGLVRSFAASPVRVLSQPQFLGARAPVPLPLARRFPVAAAPVPLSPSPLAALPLQAAAPAPVPLARAAVPAPLPLRAATPAPLPLAAPVPAPLPLAAGAPVPLVRSPVAALTPASFPSSQFHAQDELGGFNFGYQNVNSGRQEVRTPDGVTRGSYSYVDANGLPQVVNYIADPVNGFRVEATNLPVGPAAPGVLPVGPVDTAEVRLAKEEFQLAFDRAVAQAEAEAVLEIAADQPELVIASRKKRSPIAPGYGIPAAPPVVVETPAVVPVPAPAPIPVATVPVATTVVDSRRRLLPAPIAAPLVRSPLVRALPAGGFLPAVGPAPIVPGPARVIPAAAAQVRTPILAAAPLAAPITPAVTPNAVPIPAPVETTSQFHAQDELGGFTFGYQGPTSGRQETRTADGVTRGSYSYVDANGVTQTVQYIADALGFRVAASNLPVA